MQARAQGGGLLCAFDFEHDAGMRMGAKLAIALSDFRFPWGHE